MLCLPAALERSFRARTFVGRFGRTASALNSSSASKTFFHEVGHVALGHCDEKDFSESEITPRDVREVEAEAVALLCCESLGVPGAI